MLKKTEMTRRRKVQAPILGRKATFSTTKESAKKDVIWNNVHVDVYG